MPDDLRMQIEAAEAKDGAGEEGVDVYAENMDALRLFTAMRTQWVIHGFSGSYLGLNYTSLQYIPQWVTAKKKHRNRLFTKLQILERAAMSEYAEQAKKRGR